MSCPHWMWHDLDTINWTAIETSHTSSPETRPQHCSRHAHLLTAILLPIPATAHYRPNSMGQSILYHARNTHCSITALHQLGRSTSSGRILHRGTAHGRLDGPTGCCLQPQDSRLITPSQNSHPPPCVMRGEHFSTGPPHTVLTEDNGVCVLLAQCSAIVRQYRTTSDPLRPNTDPNRT